MVGVGCMVVFVVVVGCVGFGRRGGVCVDDIFFVICFGIIRCGGENLIVYRYVVSCLGMESG